MHYKVILFFVLITALISCSSTETGSKSFDSNESAAEQNRLISVSSPDTNASEPAIAAANDGTVFVVWVEHGANNEADLMIRSINEAGQSKGETVRINPEIGQVKAWYGDPPTIKIGRDGTIYVGWTAKADVADKAANILYLSVSRNGGQSFEAPVKINDDTAPASHGMHSLALDDSGRIYAAWLDERYLNGRREQAAVKRNELEGFRAEKTAFFEDHQRIEHKPEPNAELYFAVSNDGGKTFAPNKKIAGDVCPCCKTSLLAASDGHLYVSWRQVLPGDFRHIAVAVSADAGNSFTAPTIVSDDRWQISACPVSGPAMIEDSDKFLKIAWFTAGMAGKHGIYWAESKDFGKTFSPRILVSENASNGTPSLIFDASKANRIVWTEGGKVMTAVLPADENVIEKQQIGEGEHPEAAFSDQRIFIGFLDKENEKQNIKLSIIK